MNLGPLNRRARLWRDYPVIGLGGAVKPTVAPLRYMPVTVGEVALTDATVALRDSSDLALKLTTRFFTLDRSATYYVDFEGPRYRLKSWKELGRREGLVLTLEANV